MSCVFNEKEKRVKDFWSERDEFVITKEHTISRISPKITKFVDTPGWLGHSARNELRSFEDSIRKSRGIYQDLQGAGLLRAANRRTERK